MPDILAQALAVPGWGWLIVGSSLAGFVRGFSGFGSAMIYLPFAAQVLSPAWAILSLVALDLLGPLPVLRRATRDANHKDLVLLVGLAVLSIPIGAWLLTVIAPETYRYILCGLTIGLVVSLIAGLRFEGTPTPRLVGATGAAAGVSAGLAGLPGPPVILLYMASKLPVSQVRANTMLFLFIADFLMLGALTVMGQFSIVPICVGLILAIPYALGSLAGQAIFDPSKADVYRWGAYAIMAASAVVGLPIWDG